MAFQYEDDFFDDSMDEELGDAGQTLADIFSGGLASAGKATTQRGAPQTPEQEQASIEFLKGLYGPSVTKSMEDVTAGQYFAPTSGQYAGAGTAAPAGMPGLTGITPGAGGAAATPPVTFAQLTSPTRYSGGPALSTPGVAPHLESPGAIDVSGILSKLDPRLRSILGGVTAMRLQAQATSEHNSLANEAAFRKDVIRRLTLIESRLPKSSPLAQGIRTVKVLLNSPVI